MSPVSSNTGWPPRRVAVFRALQLGDMLCALPTLRALRWAWPGTHITLIGLPWTRALCERLPWVDDFIAFPGHAALPEQAEDVAARPAFEARVAAARLDLLIQLHGSGQVVNALLARLPSRCHAGFVPEGSPVGPLQQPWPRQGHEIHRLLSMLPPLRIFGADPALTLSLEGADHERARALVGDGAAYACVHVGARWPSRRWPAERFAALADDLAAQGLRVLLTGSEEERALVDRAAAAMHRPAWNLCGRTDLWTLAALLARARVLVCNDTGVSHLAVAVGCPSLVLSCGSEVARWAPLDRQRHRVLWQAVECRPCMAPDCPHGVPLCGRAIAIEDARAALAALLREQGTGLAEGRHVHPHPCFPATESGADGAQPQRGAA